MRRRLNVRLFLQTIAAVALLVLCVYVVHAFQVQRQSAALVRQAVQAEQEGNHERAAQYLHAYLALVPGDTDALARYGGVLTQLATTDDDRYRAYQVLEQVQRREPRRADILKQLVHLSLAMRRFTDAARHLEALKPIAADPADICSALGYAYLGAREYQRAADAFTEAIRHAPAQVSNYVQLADLYGRRLDQPERGAEMLDELVAKNPRSAAALLARARWRELHDARDEAAADLAKAEELAPDDPAVPLTAAEFALRQDRLDEARAHLERGFRVRPDDPRLHEAAGNLAWQSGRREEAIKHFRRGLAKAPTDAPLLLELAEALLEGGKEMEAAEVRERLAKGAPPAAWTDYLDARLAMRQGEWFEAARLLEQVPRELNSPVAWGDRIEQARARCYERSGDPTARLEAARAAVRLNPSSLLARTELAGALRQAGRINEAVDAGRNLVKRTEAPQAAWIELARALIEATRRLPSSERDWADAEEICQTAAKMGETPTVTLLLAEAQSAQGRFKEADNLLEKACDRYPQEPNLWIARADLATGHGQFDEGGAILDAAAKRFGDKADLRMARARWLTGRALSSTANPSEMRKALNGLAADLDRFTPDEQGRVLQAVAGALAQVGDADQAARAAKQWVARRPDDLAGWLVLFDLGRSAGDAALMEQALAGIRRLTGENSAVWRAGEAWRRIELARRGGQANLKEARTFLDQAAHLQPEWGRVDLLKAYLVELEGQADQALEHLLRAFERGEREGDALIKLVDQLAQRGRLAEADRVLRRVRSESPELGSLARPAAEVALRLRDFSTALELARKVAPATSRDYRDHLWLAHVLEEAGQVPEALEVLQKATDRFSDSSGCWMVRVVMLCGAGRSKEAADVLRQAEGRLAATPLHLARCYEALGRVDEAEARYKAALIADPLDPFTLQTVARFYLDNDRPAAAEPALRGLLAPQTGASVEQAALARRELALALAAPGTEEAVRAALALLDARPSGDAVADKRTRALVLAARPDRRREALQTFEASATKRPLTPDEQFRLAQLYDAENDRPRARELFFSLLTTHDRNPRFLAAHIHFLLARDELEEAKLWLAKLEKVEPDLPRTEALRKQLARKAAEM